MYNRQLWTNVCRQIRWLRQNGQIVGEIKKNYQTAQEEIENLKRLMANKEIRLVF